MTHELFNLTGKSIYITGGSSGIGYAVASVMIELGATVIIADIVDASAIATKIGAHYVFCNVADEASVEKSFHDTRKLFNTPLDAIILNAGVGDVGPNITETEQAIIEKITRINQWGVLFGLKHGPAFIRDGGSIIATSSMASKIKIPGTAVYSAAKAAINSMVKMSALELGSRAIRVNAVCPGYVATSMGNSAEERAMSETFTALGRHAQPKEDLAGVYAFLCSNASQYITGQTLNIDGGWSCGPTPRLIKIVTGAGSPPGS